MCDAGGEVAREEIDKGHHWESVNYLSGLIKFSNDLGSIGIA